MRIRDLVKMMLINFDPHTENISAYKDYHRLAKRFTAPEYSDLVNKLRRIAEVLIPDLVQDRDILRESIKELETSIKSDYGDDFGGWRIGWFKLTEGEFQSLLERSAARYLEQFKAIRANPNKGQLYERTILLYRAMRERLDLVEISIKEYLLLLKTADGRIALSRNSVDSRQGASVVGEQILRQSEEIHENLRRAREEVLRIEHG